MATALPQQDAEDRHVKINNITVRKDVVIDYPVLFNIHSIPPHACLNAYKPQIQNACSVCLTTQARLRNVDNELDISSIQMLPSLCGCTCRNARPNSLLTQYPLENVLHEVAYRTSYQELPPAFPTLSDRIAISISGVPVLPDEFVPTNETPYSWPRGLATVSLQLKLAKQYLFLCERIIPSDDYFRTYHTFCTAETTHNHLDQILDKIRQHRPMAGPILTVIPLIKTHYASLIRMFRDVIIWTDHMVEQIRRYIPETWQKSEIFSCYTLEPLDIKNHHQLSLARFFLLQVPLFVAYLRQYPLPEHDETVLSSHLAPCPPLPESETKDAHRDMLWALVHNMMEATVSLSCFSYVCMRRFYFASWSLYSFKFSFNNNLHGMYVLYYEDLHYHGRMKDLCVRPSYLTLQRRHFAPQQPAVLPELLANLLQIRTLWDFPNIPKIRYVSSLHRFFPNLPTSFDLWRSQKQAEGFSDTCPTTCILQCKCRDQTMESQLLRFEISSHLPLGWPFMPKDTSNKILLDDNFVVQDDAIQSMRNPFAFSEPIEEQEVTLPDIDLPEPPTSSLLAEASVLTQDTEPLPRTPPCIPPRRSLAQQQATTTQDARTTTTPPPPRLEPLGQNRGMSTPPRPASPAPESSPRLRRTHRLQPPFMFFILAILFLLGTALGSSVARKGHFLFETVTPHVLVSPDTRTYARKLDFTTVKNSLKQLHKVKDQYITICHQILRSDTMVPTYLLVKDVTLEHDAATSCIRREYLPPTIEHSGEQKEMYDLLTEHKLRTAVSPYYGEGPGALQLNVLLDDGESLSPAVLPFTPDRFHTNIDGNFPSVFRVGSNNTIHLTFMFNASLSEMELPPLMKTKHALICKNPNAGFLTNFVTNSSTHPVLHSLCNTDRHSFETEISKLEKLLHILEPQYIASLEASYYNMDYKPPSFLTFPMPKNTQAFHPLPQQANASRFTRDSSKPMPPLGKSLTNFAKKISKRRKRALPALLAGGAIAALLVAGVVMSSVNMAKNADLQKQITDLAADVTDISLLQQDFQKALQDVAERQKNIAESLSHLDSATSASILLLQLKTSFNYIVLKRSSERRTDSEIRGFGTTPFKQKTILNKYKYFKDQYAVKNRYIHILFYFLCFCALK